jgi:hypothetical protein
MKGDGRNWFLGKTAIEVYGEKRAKEISDKSLSTRRKNNSLFGKAKTIKLEKLRCKHISESMKGNKNGFGKYKRYNIKYKNYILKSGWELKVAQHFDNNKIDFLYEPTTFSLNKKHTYTPDFLLLKGNLYIEVKGYWRKENKEKFKLFKKLYPNILIEIWQRKKLKELKIL